MILTNDTMSVPPKKKITPVVLAKGTRTLAKEFFENNVSAKTQNWLLGVTVMITAGANKASGVIVAFDSTSTYVLTAKHALYTLSGTLSYGKTKPEDYNNDTFFNTLRINYNPGTFHNKPAKEAIVTGLDFTGSDDQTWEYDIVSLVSTDADLLAFAKPLTLISTKEQEDKYKELLKIPEGGGKGAEALNQNNYEFFQLGYGDGKDKNWPAIKSPGWTDKGTMFQCKKSTPIDTKPLDGVFETDSKAGSKPWPLSDQILMLKADSTNSTGPGDSGGPLFCRLIKDKNQVYLVGLTAGANYDSDAALLKENAKLPVNNTPRNNAVTYFYQLFDKWKWI